MYDLYDLIKEAYDKWGGRKYIFERTGDVFEGVTFGHFLKDTDSLARALLNMGFADKKIMIYSENSYNWMITDIAVMAYVGVSMGADCQWRGLDLTNAIELTEPAAVVYSESRAAQIKEIEEYYPDTHFIPMSSYKKLLRTGEKLRGDAELFSFKRRDTYQCCKIVFSSGTTSFPKAVMLSQHNMFACHDCLWERSPFGVGDSVYLFLPLHHTYGGLCNFIYSLVSGYELYICSDPREIPRELSIVKPTVMCSVPKVLEMLWSLACENERPYRALGDVLGGKMRDMFTAGAHLKSEIKDAYKQAGINLMESYGLSETSSLVTTEYPFCVGSDSKGYVLEIMDVKIVDADEHGIGEIAVKGDNVFMGYYGNDIATARAFDASGYFLTGDTGYFDEDRLYVIGRKKRMILTGNGENVSPDELEHKLTQFRGVKFAKVFQRGDVIAAALYVENGNVDAKAIIDSFNNTSPFYKRITDYSVYVESPMARMK